MNADADVRAVEEANRAADLLMSAREQIQEVNQQARPAGEARGILTLIQQAMEQSKRPEIQSEAQLALGDYYWALFNAPPPLADTRPVEVPEDSPSELLDKAEAAYAAAMKDAGGRPYVATRARFGIATVEQGRAYDAMRRAGYKNVDTSAFLEKARQRYQAIVDDATTPQELKDEAKWHLDQLKEANRPIWVAAPPPSTATTGASGVLTTQGATSLPAERVRVSPDGKYDVFNGSLTLPGTRPTTGATTRPAK